MTEKKDLSSRLKDLGIEISNAAKKEYKAVVSGAEKQIRNDKLRRRFNLENPYRFVLVNNQRRFKILDTVLAKHAKRYLEDDILVFYGSKADNQFESGQKLKDLSDNTIYEILEIVDVMLPVNYNNKSIEVACTAIYGKVL